MGSEDQAVAQGEELLEVEGQLQVAVVMLRKDVRRPEDICLEVGPPGGVVLMVTGVVHHSCLDLEVASAFLLGLRDDPGLDVEVVERVVMAGYQALVLCMPGADIPECKPAGPTPVAFAEAALQAGLDAEYIPSHEVETAPHVGDRIELGYVEGGCSVETVEVRGLVSEPGYGCGHPQSGYQVLAVEETVQDGVALGVP